MRRKDAKPGLEVDDISGKLGGGDIGAGWGKRMAFEKLRPTYTKIKQVLKNRDYSKENPSERINANIANTQRIANTVAARNPGGLQQRPAPVALEGRIAAAKRGIGDVGSIEDIRSKYAKKVRE